MGLARLQKLKNKLKNYIFISIIAIVWYLELHTKFYYEYYYPFFHLEEYDFYSRFQQRDFSGKRLVYRSNCVCRKNESILLENNNDRYVNISMINENNSEQEAMTTVQNSYQIDKPFFLDSTFTCDMYNTLRRGPNQKIISFALYGKGSLYYHNIKQAIKTVAKIYPNWTIRINHDSTIRESVKCEYECLKNEKTGELYDNVDFCNMEQIPLDLHSVWSAEYIHGMMWRWLSVGDSFVDFVSSRDTDSIVTKREQSSVDVWMESDKLFHVMRDNPVHNTEIMGGTSGYANVRDRDYAKYLFKVMTNPTIAHYYNRVKHEKGRDQHMLRAFFSGKAYESSVMHDSYLCRSFGGEPFPTQRVGDCYVGSLTCNPEGIPRKICPKHCRPKDHQNWIYC